MRYIRSFFFGLDPILLVSSLLIALLGIVTMYTYQGENYYFTQQLVWILIACGVLLLALVPDYRFLRSGNMTFYFYIVSIAVLLLLFLFGDITLGAQRRFDLGLFSFQPSDPVKLILIMVLAKYFSKRHEMIGDIRHIIISGIYTFIPFALIFLQPDFGTAMVLFFIWIGMVLVAGIKMRHLFMVFGICVLAAGFLWQFALADYQKARVTSFLNPLEDMQGSGYNAYQSQVAVGSGQIFGKGVGYGTQSKLLYLPEYQTDFIFAAFAEEWGLLGVLLLFGLFAILLGRLFIIALASASNFETLFTVGVALLIGTHFFIHVGMNVGVLPVTGLTLPFMSYGGSHLLTGFLALGIVMGMHRYAPIRTTAPVEHV